MLDQESAGYLGQYPNSIKALVEDAAKSLSITIEKPTAADIANGRIMLIPTSVQLADAHYNAGFLRRSCQNHGIRMTWEGEKKPESLDSACAFYFITVAEHEKRKAAEEKAAAEKVAAPSAPVKPAAPAISSGTVADTSKSSASPGNNSK